MPVHVSRIKPVNGRRCLRLAPSITAKGCLFLFLGYFGWFLVHTFGLANYLQDVDQFFQRGVAVFGPEVFYLAIGTGMDGLFVAQAVAFVQADLAPLVGTGIFAAGRLALKAAKIALDHVGHSNFLSLNGSEYRPGGHRHRRGLTTKAAAGPAGRMSKPAPGRCDKGIPKNKGRRAISRRHP